MASERTAYALERELEKVKAENQELRKYVEAAYWSREAYQRLRRQRLQQPPTAPQQRRKNRKAK